MTATTARTGWGPWEATGNRNEFQSYPDDGPLGVIGGENEWVVVYSSDGVEFNDSRFPVRTRFETADEACGAAERYAEDLAAA